MALRQQVLQSFVRKAMGLPRLTFPTHWCATASGGCGLFTGDALRCLACNASICQACAMIHHSDCILMPVDEFVCGASELPALVPQNGTGTPRGHWSLTRAPPPRPAWLDLCGHSNWGSLSTAAPEIGTPSCSVMSTQRVRPLVRTVISLIELTGLGETVGMPGPCMHQLIHQRQFSLTD